METVLLTNVFFVITGLAILVIAIALLVVLIIAIKILRDISQIVKNLKEGSQVAAEDFKKLRLRLSESAQYTAKGGFGSLKSIFTTIIKSYVKRK